LHRTRPPPAVTGASNDSVCCPGHHPRRDARAAESARLESVCGSCPPWVRIPLPPHRRSGRSPDRPGLSVLAGTSVPLGSPPNRRIRDRCCQRCCQTWCLIRTLRCGRTAGSARWRPSQTARGNILTLRNRAVEATGCRRRHPPALRHAPRGRESRVLGRTFSDSAHVVRAPRAADLARRHRPLPYDRCADLPLSPRRDGSTFWRR
jgi:hypothetical protein